MVLRKRKQSELPSVGKESSLFERNNGHLDDKLFFVRTLIVLYSGGKEEESLVRCIGHAELESSIPFPRCGKQVGDWEEGHGTIRRSGVVALI